MRRTNPHPPLRNRPTRRTPSRRAAGALALLAAAGLIACPAKPLQAAPQGANVVHGQADLAKSGDTTTITASNNAIIDYHSFDIAGHETVRFVQPGASSRVLNRVVNGEMTRINGRLLSNGHVYLANPAGIYFGNKAIVNVGAITAAAGRIANADFLGRADRFTDINGSLVNDGTIAGDAVRLIGNHVANHGQIVAPGGMVALSAGQTVYLSDIASDGGLMVEVDGGNPDADPDAPDRAETHAVENTGDIDAPGGSVSFAASDVYTLAARQAGNVNADRVDVDAPGGEAALEGDTEATSAVHVNARDIRQTGRIRAGETAGGTIELHADATYHANAHATLDASGRGGPGGRIVIWSDHATTFNGQALARAGGFIEVSSAGELTLGPDMLLDTAGGALLFDPKNIIVTDTPPNGTGNPSDGFDDNPAADSFLLPDQIKSALASNDLTLQANNDITIADPIDASGGIYNLALLAGRSILIEADLLLPGDFAAEVNVPESQGVILAERDSGPGRFDMLTGTIIDAAGRIAVTVHPGANLQPVGNQDEGGFFLSEISDDPYAFNGPSGPGLLISELHSGSTADNAIAIDAVGDVRNANLESTDPNLDAPDGGAVLEVDGYVGDASDPVRTRLDRLAFRVDNGGIDLVNNHTANDLLDLIALPGGQPAGTFGGGATAIENNSLLTIAADYTFESDASLQATDNSFGFSDNVTIAPGVTLALASPEPATLDLLAGDSVVLDPGARIEATGDPGNTVEFSADFDSDGGNNVIQLGGEVDAPVIQMDGDVILTGDVNLFGRDVTFNGRINSAVETRRRLDILMSGGGETIFNEDIGTSVPLGHLGTAGDGTTVFNTSVIIVDGPASAEFDNAARVSQDLEINELGGGPVTFGSSVDAASGTSPGLTVNNAGPTNFQGPVGGQEPLGSITTDAPGTTTIGDDVTTTGDQTYNDRVTAAPDANFSGSNVSFEGGFTVALAGSTPNLAELLPGGEAGTDDEDAAGAGEPTSELATALSEAGIDVPGALRDTGAEGRVQNAVDDYLLSLDLDAEFTAAGFVQFLTARADQRPAAQTLFAVRDTLEAIDESDLGDAEKAALREQVIDRMRPAGISRAEFEAVLDALPRPGAVAFRG